MLILIRRVIAQCLVLFLSCFISTSLYADIVKPALIEISINQLGQVDIEARVSIEALLTGINSQYKNTQDSPNAAEYDVFREMQSDELHQEFIAFQEKFLNSINLNSFSSNSKEKTKLLLEISEIIVPEPGYTKVPRISLLKLKSSIELDQVGITWYYPSSFGDNAVRLRQVDNENKKYHWSEWQWLRNDKPSEPFSLTEIIAKTPLIKTISNYIALGFLHILPKGLDHILFILGLFFFAAAMKPLFWQVTMFTVAHSITLGLSMNGVISLPANIVEPLIALSIAYIGIENILSNRSNSKDSDSKELNSISLNPKGLKNSRLLIVFLFGLLHGLGFASVLAEFGLPDKDFVTALISFNIGVELGQLAIIMAAFLLIGLWFRNKSWYRASIIVPASLIISITGIYWFIQRLDLNF